MYVYFCFTLNHISSSSSPGNSHIPVRQIITSLMKEDYYYYFFLSRILRLFFGAFSVSNLFSNLFISTVLYFSANTTTALLSEVVLYSIFFHVIICTGCAEGKSGCTASLNVDANTEINGHRKKKRHSKKRKSISKDSRSHTVSHFFFFLHHHFFCSLSLAPSDFHSPFFSSCSLFFSSWPFYSVSFTPLHNTKTRHMHLDCKCTVKHDDMSTGHCVLTEQRKPGESLWCSLYPQGICASVFENKAGKQGLKYLLVKMTPDCGRGNVSTYHCTLTSTPWPCETPDVTRMSLCSRTVKVI